MTLALLDRCMRYIGTSIAYSHNDSDEKFALLEALRAEIAKPERNDAFLIVPNMKEAYELACMKLRESNLAACFVRLYLQAELAKPEQAPAWHDAPTVPGIWLGDYGVASTVTEHDVKTWTTTNSKSRWYGPIPEDKT